MRIRAQADNRRGLGKWRKEEIHVPTEGQVQGALVEEARPVQEDP
jgi:hypothetical protein